MTNENSPWILAEIYAFILEILTKIINTKFE